jgi:hypothetical protein
VEASYHKYKTTGSNTFIAPNVMFKENIVELDRTFSSGTLPYTLPVSISKYGALTEFEDKIELSDPLNQHDMRVNQPFPCHSGDWTGSETEMFMKRLGVGVNSKDVKSKRAKELIQEICRSYFRILTASLQHLASSLLNRI